jgi:membrane fusion protein (multidrug efflux system)
MKLMINSLCGCRLYLCCNLIILLNVTGCSSSVSKANEEPSLKAEPSSLEVFTLQKGKLSSSLKIPGELIAFQQVDLYAKVNSFVKKLFVDVGSQVLTGQLLATLEAPEMGSQLAGAESRLKSQEAIYLASKASYDRLFETSQTPGTVSENELEQALAKKNSDLAQWEAAKSAYKEIAEIRNYLEIRAPFNGVISTRNVNTGAYVGPSGKGSELPLFTLQEQKKLRLVISVPEISTGFLNTKSMVSFNVKSLPHEKFSARVMRLAGALDNHLRSERVEMDVANNDRRLLPGMVAEVEIPMAGKDSTFLVPRSALVNSTERLFVIQMLEKKARWIDIQKGREEGGYVEIYGDLKAGDTLIKNASDEIRNGSVISSK